MERPFLAYRGEKQYIFVSYAHADDALVYPELDWLQKNGCNIWYDEGIHAGSVWRDELADRLTHADLILFVATEDSVNSRNCLNELHFAMDLDKPILVVQFQELNLPAGLRFGLGSRQAIIKSHYDDQQFRKVLWEALDSSGDDDGLAAPSEPAPLPQLSAVSVLVAEFANETETPAFAGVVENVLVNSLDSATNAEILSIETAKSVAVKIKDDSSITTLGCDLARLVAFREGVQFVIGGSIKQSNDTYVIQIEVWSIHGSHNSDEPLSAIVVVAEGKDDVLLELTRSLPEVFADLKVDVSTQILKDEESITTTSLEAAHHYALGQEAQTLWSFESAIDHYQQAIDFDPEFGRAYTGLATMYANMGNNLEARKYYQLALTHIDRMNDREKCRSQGSYYLMIRNCDKAIEQYDELLSRHPTDEAGNTNLALAHFYNRDIKKAIGVAEAWIDKNPLNSLLKVNLALYTMYAGDLAKCRDLANTLLEENPNIGALRLCLAVTAVLDGNTDEAFRIYEDLSNGSQYNAYLSQLGLADLEISCGQLDKAIERLENLRTNTNSDRSLIDVNLAEAYAYSGKREAAREVLDGIESDVPSILFQVARTYIELEANDKVSQIIDSMKNRIELDSKAHGLVLEALLLISQGQYADAMKVIEASRKLVDSSFSRYVGGLCYLHMNAYIEAYGEIEACLKRSGEMSCMFLDEVPTMRFLVPVYYYKGRAQEGLGSKAAQKTYQKFLGFWGTEEAACIDIVRDANSRVSQSSG